MQRISPLVLGLIVLCSCYEVAGRETTSRPNILVVLVDDLRWDELGCTGHPFARTPHIDRIAHEGVRFRNAFCTTPLCSPVRASLLTGLYTHHHGILDNTDRSKQSHRLVTFPQALQRAGYETGFIGKWHMGNDDTSRPGFDHWIGLKGQGMSFDPPLNENGKRVQATGHTTDVLNRRAVAFVSNKRHKPFCLYVSHKALHPELVQYDDGSISDPKAAKFMAAERHRQLYAEAAIPRRLNVIDALTGKPALRQEIKGLPELGPDTGTSDETVRDRQRMLVAVDEGVGLLLAALEKTGQLDSTLVVFTSDHGYWYGEHGLSVERRLAYEEGIRVPLLMRFPSRIKAGQVVDQFALSIDLAPTVIEFAGATISHPIDGRSLAPLLDERAQTDWRTSFLIEYNTDTVFPRVRNMGYQAVRTTRWKYIHYNDLQGMDEFYDLQNDPYEIENLIGHSAAQTALKQMQTELDALLSDQE